MPLWYMLQNDGTAIQLAEEYDTAQEADDAANELEIYGTPIEATVWQSGSEVTGIQLKQAKFLKILELRREGRKKLRQAAPSLDDAQYMIDSAIMVSAMVKTADLTTDGLMIKQIRNKFLLARQAIKQLTDKAAVQAYNVETDPGW